MVINLFLLIRFNYSYRTLTHFDSSCYASFDILKYEISTSKGKIALIPYVKEYEVALVDLFGSLTRYKEAFMPFSMVNHHLFNYFLDVFVICCVIHLRMIRREIQVSHLLPGA